jgi:serine/threonine/tyrosine protein kinase RAD53
MDLENLNGYHDEDESMVNDGDGGDEEGTQETQPATQTGLTPSQTTSERLWGFLQPSRPELKRIEFPREQPIIRIGRNKDKNEVVLPGAKVSNEHCVIQWDGLEGAQSVVVVQDKSTNGTWVAHKKIGKGKSGLLKHGEEIAFGTTWTPSDQVLEDYRFTFIHTAAPPVEGVYSKYEVCHELGKGTFATVKKAICRLDAKFYALKFINGKAMRHTQGASRASGNDKAKEDPVEREIKVLGTLQHEHICQLKEVFLQPNPQWCLVLEYVAGGDLLDYILNNDGVAEPMAKHFTYQMVDALAYCHGLRVTHRDLKPENVLLTTDNPPNIKVADFGLAKMVDSQTMLRTMCGTPSYLAPEVVTQQNREGYDEGVDCWSVGVIEYSMLTNATPFIEDENILDVRVRIAQRQIEWSCLTNSDVSPQVQDLIKRLLEYDPRKRISMKGALEHPWLQSYVPPHGNASSSSLASGPGVNQDYTMDSINDREEGRASMADMSMIEAGADTPSPPPESHSQGSNSQRAAGAYANPINGNGVARDGSRHLQRRSEAVKQPLNIVIPQDLLDGVAKNHPACELRDGAGTIPVSTTSISPESGTSSSTVTPIIANSSSQGKKRMREELTPLSELEEEDRDIAMDIASPRKKSRSPNGDVLPSKVNARASSKKPRASRARGATSDAEDQLGLRRSSRNTGKR